MMENHKKNEKSYNKNTQTINNHTCWKISKHGFTLAELLIVVAMITVLVAIAIPIFTKQLERSRESADAANIRSQYAEVMAEAITNGADVNVDGLEFQKLI